MIEDLTLKDFTAFHDLHVEWSPGVNVVIGKNGTGKSHLLKVMYAVCGAKKDATRSDKEAVARAIGDKLTGVFKPEKNIGRLCRDGAEKTSVRVSFGFDKAVEFGFTSEMTEVSVAENKDYHTYSWAPVFLPPKEILSMFEGLAGLIRKRELSIDETYADLCDALELPLLRGRPTDVAKHVLELLEQGCSGKFMLMQNRFYYKPTEGNSLEVELAAEGHRKLGILQRLIQTGSINPGVSGTLFWDEPEANLNPSLMKVVVTILLELARAGQQVILATHDYVVLKWFDLLKTNEDKLLFHALFRDDAGTVRLNTTADYLQIEPNAIDDTFAELVDKDVEQSMGRLGK